MKVSINWLKEYVALTLPPAEIAERLTMAGHEVKGVEIIGESWANVVIGRITAVNPHPNADRLRLATVELATGQETVVCGAPNLNIGDKIAFASVGARLIDGHSGEVATLKPARIRGVASSGMICSEKELGISDRHDGIMVLPADAPLSTALADYLGDAVLSLDITPNRPDCLSVIGIAREVAALTGQSLRLPDYDYRETDAGIDNMVAVEITAPDLCPRYCATLITGVKLAESPPWMQRRLLASGMRPINNIVDITNYVMMEYGQPLHAFDYESIGGSKIIVRRAAEGERIFTLDGQERQLSGDMLVIADDAWPVAVAGVMGGASSEVVENTTTILLEAASFKPSSIHYTGRTLRLPSEACMRFERGISPSLTLPALRRATQLIAELAGGKVAKGIIDVYPGKKEKEPLKLPTGEVNRLLGVEFSEKQITNTLNSLGFDCRPVASDSEVAVSVPYWRSDINLTVDLVEEVARVIGYDRIPTTMLSRPIPGQNPEPITGLKRKIVSHLAGYGFQEILSYSLTSLEMLNRVSRDNLESAALRVANPMSSEQEYLRTSLRANLLATLAANRRYDDGGIKLFELSRVYRPRPGDLPDERETLCGLLSGPLLDESWFGSGESADFFAVKGVVEALLSQLGVTAGFEPGSDRGLHPVKQARMVIDGNTIGIFGELHPEVQRGFDIVEPVYLFEIDLTELLPLATRRAAFKPVPRFPAVLRDMALVVAVGVSHRQIIDIIRDYPLVDRVAIFDVYSGDQVPAGKKSMAYRITYQSPDHTLTDDEVNGVQQQILSRLSAKFGAVLRD